jgi:hypothetical protein
MKAVLEGRQRGVIPRLTQGQGLPATVKAFLTQPRIMRGYLLAAIGKFHDNHGFP